MRKSEDKMIYGSPPKKSMKSINEEERLVRENIIPKLSKRDID